MDQKRGRPKSGPQKYLMPSGAEIKVEIIGNRSYVADLPEGAERISYYEMIRLKWRHLGPWDFKNESKQGAHQ